MINNLITQEPFVVALLQLALDLLDRVKTDADDDQDRGAAEREVLIGVEKSNGNRRDAARHPR